MSHINNFNTGHSNPFDAAAQRAIAMAKTTGTDVYIVTLDNVKYSVSDSSRLKGVFMQHAILAHVDPRGGLLYY